MKTRKQRLYCLIFSIVICFNFLTANVFAEANDDVTVVALEHQNETDSQGSDTYSLWNGICNHFCNFTCTNNSNGSFGKLQIKIMHTRTGYKCNHEMSWRIQFIYTNPENGIPQGLFLSRYGVMNPGLTNIEDFGGPVGYIFKYRVIIEVMGKTVSSDWQTEKF